MAFSEQQQEIVDQITSLLQQLEASTIEPEPEPFEVTDQDFDDLVDRVDDLENEYNALAERVTTLETTVAAIQPQIDEITEKQGYEEDRLDKVITEQDVAIPAILKHFQPQP